jgi:DNA repair protein RadC
VLAGAEGSLRRIAMQPVATLTALPGVGTARAATIHAALELGRRMAAETRDDGAPVRSPRDVVELFACRLQDLPVEEFHVAVLDSQHRLERDIMVTRGILNSSLVHPREVFREAIAERAAAIILVHNHPSGDPTPSADDRVVTEQLVAAGRLLDIPVHDHIVIGRGRYTSFAEAGLL